MTKQRLVILSPGFPENEQDTSCLPFAQQFVLSLQKLQPSLEVIVISLHYPFQKRTYTWHGTSVFAMGGQNRGKLYALRTRRRAYRQLAELYRQNPSMMLLSFWLTDCALVGDRFSKKHNVKHLTWVIGQDAKPGNRHVARIHPKSDRLIAMSDFLQQELDQNYGIRPAHVVNNGINEAMFLAFNTGGRPVDVLGAGSLIPLKNYELFVEVVAALKPQFPGIKACIVGEGQERGKLEALIKTHGLENNLKLLGQKTHAEVLQLMSQSKVFLHTSDYEGNSTVLAEALYAGCNVVSTRPLSSKAVPNLAVAGSKEALALNVASVLSQGAEHQQILFNSMDQSAAAILALFGA